MRRLLLVLPLLLTPVPRAAAGVASLHVEDGRIVDPEGRTVILRGVNAMDKVFGADGNLDPDLTDADLDRIVSIGFNTIRLGTSWAAVEPSPGVYDDAFIDRFRTTMDRIGARGLHVVVDMHQDVWGEALGGNGAPAWATPSCNVPPDVPLARTTGQWFMDYFTPDTQAAFSNFWADGSPDLFCTGPVQTHFVAMWTHLASRLAGHPALAGYDLLNEPWPGLPPGAFEVAQLYPFYERLIASIRAYDSSTIVFFEPPISKSAGLPAVPLGVSDRNVVYAPHLYTETMYSGGSLTTHAATDDVVLTTDEAEADVMDVPFWIGEWGAFENGAAATYQREIYDILDRLQAGSAYWHYTQGYSDGLKGQPLSADAGHIRVYPCAFPGSAHWTYIAAARAFQMSVHPFRGSPTVELSVPSRLYPSGVRFAPSASGDTVAYDGERAIWTLDPSAPGHTLVISPAPS